MQLVNDENHYISIDGTDFRLRINNKDDVYEQLSHLTSSDNEDKNRRLLNINVKEYDLSIGDIKLTVTNFGVSGNISLIFDSDDIKQLKRLKLEKENNKNELIETIDLGNQAMICNTIYNGSKNYIIYSEQWNLSVWFHNISKGRKAIEISCLEI